MLETPVEFEEVLDHIDATKNKLRKSVSGLMNLLDIDEFSTLRVRDHSVFSGIHINPIIPKDYIYSSNPMPIVPVSGFYFASSFPEVFTPKILDHHREQLEIDNLLFYVEVHRCYQDIYIFGSKPGKKEVINNYLNNAQKILQFIPYFKIESKSLLESMYKRTFIYVQDVKMIMSNLSPHKAEIGCADQRLNGEEIKEFEKRLMTLSEREYQCVQLAAGCLTAKEVARMMGISYRTVEAYLASAKYKLGVNSKREMIAVYLAVTS